MEKTENPEKLTQHLRAALASGENRLSQSVVEQSMEIDDTWVVTIEDALHSIENIVADPKSFIKDDYYLVSVERAKKVDGYAMRHLASHSEYVKRLEDDGTVTPSKVMTKQMSQDFAIYENRVVYTLIDRLIDFVESRYRKIKELSLIKDRFHMGYSSDFKAGGGEFSYRLEIGVLKPSENRKRSEINADMLTRLERVRIRLQQMRGTAFYRELSKSKKVAPPINKTNIFNGNIDYRNCYNLWVFISGFDTVGYTVDIKEKTLPFDEPYFDAVTGCAAQTLTTVAAQDMARRALYAAADYKTVKRKRFKEVKSVEMALNGPGKQLFEDGGEVSQYYFDKIKSMVKEIAGFSSALDNTVVKDVSADIRRFYKGLVKINNELISDVINAENKAKYQPKTPLGRANAAVKEEQNRLLKQRMLTKLKYDEWILSKKKEERSAERVKKLTKQVKLKTEQERKRRIRDRQKREEEKKKSVRNGKNPEI